MNGIGNKRVAWLLSWNTRPCCRSKKLVGVGNNVNSIKCFQELAFIELHSKVVSRQLLNLTTGRPAKVVPAERRALGTHEHVHSSSNQIWLSKFESSARKHSPVSLPHSSFQRIRDHVCYTRFREDRFHDCQRPAGTNSQE